MSNAHYTLQTTTHWSVLSIHDQVDELLADAEFKKFQKRKYVEIIKEKDRNSGTRKFSNKKKKKVA